MGDWRCTWESEGAHGSEQMRIAYHQSLTKPSFSNGWQAPRCYPTDVDTTAGGFQIQSEALGAGHCNEESCGSWSEGRVQGEDRFQSCLRAVFFPPAMEPEVHGHH